MGPGGWGWELPSPHQTCAQTECTERGEVQSKLRTLTLHPSTPLLLLVMLLHVCITSSGDFVPRSLYLRSWPRFSSGASAQGLLKGKRGETHEDTFPHPDSVPSTFPLGAFTSLAPPTPILPRLINLWQPFDQGCLYSETFGLNPHDHQPGHHFMGANGVGELGTSSSFRLLPLSPQ